MVAFEAGGKSTEGQVLPGSPTWPHTAFARRPLFSIYCVPSRAVGGALQLHRPAPAPGLEAGGSASQGLSCLVCEMEMTRPPGWAMAGGDETLYVSFVTGLGVSRRLIKVNSQRGKRGEEIHPQVHASLLWNPSKVSICFRIRGIYVCTTELIGQVRAGEEMKTELGTPETDSTGWDEAQIPVCTRFLEKAEKLIWVTLRCLFLNIHPSFLPSFLLHARTLQHKG